MSKAWFIYGLKDPSTGLVRYVGKSDDPQKRLIAHLVKKCNRKKMLWLRELRDEGRLPMIELLECGSGAGWQDAEKRWIASFPAGSLFNIAPGGAGPHDISLIVRQKIAEANRGRKHSSETIQRMRDAFAKRSPDSIDRMRSAARSPSADSMTRWKAGMAASLLSKPKVHTDATKEKMSSAAKARWADADYRAYMLSRMVWPCGLVKSEQAKLKMRLATRWNGARSGRFKGVKMRPGTSVYAVAQMIRPDGRVVYLGNFPSQEHAAIAWDNAMWSEYGTDCYLNFPERFVQYG